MTVREYLKNYLYYKAELKKYEILRNALEMDIIESSPSGDESGISGGKTSDTVLSKVIRIEMETSELEKLIAYYKFKAGLVENALSVLNEHEREVIQKSCIENKSNKVTCFECRMSYETMNRLRKTGVNKMKPLFNFKTDRKMTDN